MQNDKIMELQNFHAAYARANLLYDVELNPTDFEEMALSGFEKIGNYRYRMYHAVVYLQPDADGGFFADLPCNCDPELIESVTLTWGENWKYTSNLTINGDWDSHYVENYIEGRKLNKSEYYDNGIFAKYTIAGSRLHFTNPYGKVHILYRGILCDDDGLPQLTEKEVEALAAYVAFIVKQKNAWRINDINSLRMSEIAKQDWMRLCSHARTPRYVNQNDFDRILDAQASFNRKKFNWSLKPVK